VALSVTALNEVVPKSEVGIVAEEVEIAAKEEVKAACELPRVSILFMGQMNGCW